MPTPSIIRLGILACIHLAGMTGVGAAELSYSLSSPLVGGNNSAPYQIELAREGQKKQIAAKAIADVKQLEYEAKAAINNSPSARFTNALQSQLFTQIAMKVSNDILSTADYDEKKFTFGEINITYRQVDASNIEITFISVLGDKTILTVPK